MTELDSNQDNPFASENIQAEETQSPSKPGPLDKYVKLARMHGANLILAGLFAAGLATVYLLSLRGGPEKDVGTLTPQEMRVSSALEKFGGPQKKTTKAKNIIKSFYFDSKQRQIPRNSLSGDPFVVYEPEPEKAEPIVPKTVKPEVDTAKVAALAAVKELKLQSILSGPNGKIAMIGNELLRQGNTVEGWTISEITPTSVVLRWRDQQHVLYIQE
jgi:hypothetical protein